MNLITGLNSHSRLLHPHAAEYKISTRLPSSGVIFNIQRRSCYFR
ncbi:hypothetical protein OROGR_005974 [Orobanche gracilis]